MPSDAPDDFSNPDEQQRLAELLSTAAPQERQQFLEQNNFAPPPEQQQGGEYNTFLDDAGGQPNYQFGTDTPYDPNLFYKQLQRRPDGTLEGVGPGQSFDRQTILQNALNRGQLSEASDQFQSFTPGQPAGGEGALESILARTKLTPGEERRLAQLQNGLATINQGALSGRYTPLEATHLARRIQTEMQLLEQKAQSAKQLAMRIDRNNQMHARAQATGMDVQDFEAHVAAGKFVKAPDGSSIYIQPMPGGKMHVQHIPAGKADAAASKEEATLAQTLAKEAHAHVKAASGIPEFTYETQTVKNADGKDVEKTVKVENPAFLAEVSRNFNQRLADRAQRQGIQVPGAPAPAAPAAPAGPAPTQATPEAEPLAAPKTEAVAPSPEAVRKSNESAVKNLDDFIHTLQRSGVQPDVVAKARVLQGIYQDHPDKTFDQLTPALQKEVAEYRALIQSVRDKGKLP